MSRLADAQAARARAQHLVDHCERELQRKTRAQLAAVAEVARAREALEASETTLVAAERHSLDEGRLPS